MRKFKTQTKQKHKNKREVNGLFIAHLLQDGAHQSSQSRPFRFGLPQLHQNLLRFIQIWSPSQQSPVYQSIRLRFTASNNEVEYKAEYEALITRLLMAKTTREKHIQAYCVVQQRLLCKKQKNGHLYESRPRS